MSGIAAVIMAGICGLSSFFVIADERRGIGAPDDPRAAVTDRVIASRQTDGRPLSIGEVFPDQQIRLVSGATPYRVRMTHIDTDCDIATTGGTGDVLHSYGCNQVVRAALTAPYGDYQVTAGVFNLQDETGAARTSERVRELVETGAGSFAAMAAGAAPGTDPRAQPLAQVSWQERGHYLLYCVIARPDRRLVTDDDQYARRITADLLESYLGDEIIGARTLPLDP